MSADKLREIATRPEETAVANLPSVQLGFNSLQSFELMQRVAKVFASSLLVPKEFQGNLPNCIIAVETASRIGASPLMVMQHLYIVHGKPAWSSQFLIAAVNACGRFNNLQYEFSGEGDARQCYAWTLEKATNRRVQGPPVSIKMAKDEGWYGKNGSKWKTMPDLMMTYRAATFFARTNAPELTMGLKTADEVIDIGPGDYRIIETAEIERQIAVAEAGQESPAGAQQQEEQAAGAQEPTKEPEKKPPAKDTEGPSGKPPASGSAPAGEAEKGGEGKDAPRSTAEAGGAQEPAAKKEEAKKPDKAAPAKKDRGNRMNLS